MRASLRFSSPLALVCLVSALSCKQDLPLGANDAGPSVVFATPGQIFIRQVFAPVTPANGTCTYTATTAQAEESTGIVDLSFTSLANYTPWVLVGNEGVPQGTENQDRVFVMGALTRITDLAGDSELVTMLATMCDDGEGDQAACKTGQALAAGRLTTPVNPFSTVETTAIEPPTGTDPSYGAIAVTLVDGGTIAVLRDYFENLLEISEPVAFTTSIQLITYTQLQGTTQAGQSVASNVYEFPVTFTYGSLIANVGTDSSGEYCIETAASLPATPTTPSVTCVAGQDGSETVSTTPNGYIPYCPGADAGGGSGEADASPSEAGDGGE